MNLEDLIKLAGVAKSPYDTPVQEQLPSESDGMRTLIALVTPEQLNQLQGDAPVAEEMPGEATTEPDPQAYEGPLGSPADLSLRRYLGANGQPVNVQENVYADHKVEDITEAWKEYKTEQKVEEEPNEANKFIKAKIDAEEDGEDSFTVDGKKYKVKDSADLDRLRQLAGTQPIDEGMEKDEVMAIMAKHPEEVAKMKQMGDLDSGSELYMELVDFYSDEMPYGTMKARDGDPVEYIMDKLDGLGMMETKVDEAPVPGEYDYSDDKYDADGAVTGVNDRNVDLRFAKWSEDTPSEVMAVINKHNITPDEAWQMGSRDNMADVDIVVDYHDKFTDRFDTSGMSRDEEIEAIDIDGGTAWMDSPEHDALYSEIINPLCKAMGMEGGNVEECGQALMKYIDENAPQESAEINDLRKLAGI